MEMAERLSAVADFFNSKRSSLSNAVIVAHGDGSVSVSERSGNRARDLLGCLALPGTLVCFMISTAAIANVSIGIATGLISLAELSDEQESSLIEPMHKTKKDEKQYFDDAPPTHSRKS